MIKVGTFLLMLRKFIKEKPAKFLCYQQRDWTGFILVPLIGVEPIRYRYRGILSPVRLPIPPHRQVDYLRYYKKKKGTCQHFFKKIMKKF